MAERETLAATWGVDVGTGESESVYLVRHQVTGRTHRVPDAILANRHPSVSIEQAAEHYALYMSMVDPPGELELVDVSHVEPLGVAATTPAREEFTLPVHLRWGSHWSGSPPIRHYTQRSLHEPGVSVGDCWTTSIECVLALPLGTLPRMQPGQELGDAWQDHWYAVQAYLYHHHRLMVCNLGRALLPGLRPRGFHLISGRSPRRPDDPSAMHCVIGYEGEVVHDPHPSRDGILDVDSWEVITPVPESMRTPDQWWPAGMACPCGCTPAVESPTSPAAVPGADAGDAWQDHTPQDGEDDDTRGVEACRCGVPYFHGCDCDEEAARG